MGLPYLHNAAVWLMHTIWRSIRSPYHSNICQDFRHWLLPLLFAGSILPFQLDDRWAICQRKWRHCTDIRGPNQDGIRNRAGQVGARSSIPYRSDNCLETGLGAIRDTSCLLPKVSFPIPLRANVSLMDSATTRLTLMEIATQYLVQCLRMDTQRYAGI